MKSLLLGLFMAIIVFTPFQPAFADVWVNGYTKSNGTYVNGYYRSSPDSSPYNNYSFPGNTNPYTGVTAGGSVSSYLKNYGSGSSYVPTYTPYTSTYIPTYSSSFLGGSSAYEEVTNGYKSYGLLICDYDYYEKDNKCVKVPKNGYAIGETLFCDWGYKKHKEKCIKPDNGSYYGDKLYCDTGYQQKGGQCVAPKNGFMLGSSLTCGDGFYLIGNSCKNIDKACKAEFGKFSIAFEEDQCTCKDGYKWNNKNVEKATKCIKDKQAAKS